MDTMDCKRLLFASAAIAQLGERQTEDLKVPGSIPGLGTFLAPAKILCESNCQCDHSQQCLRTKIECNFLEGAMASNPRICGLRCDGIKPSDSWFLRVRWHQTIGFLVFWSAGCGAMASNLWVRLFNLWMSLPHSWFFALFLL